VLQGKGSRGAAREVKDVGRDNESIMVVCGLALREQERVAMNQKLGGAGQSGSQGSGLAFQNPRNRDHGQKAGAGGRGRSTGRTRTMWMLRSGCGHACMGAWIWSYPMPSASYWVAWSWPSLLVC